MLWSLLLLACQVEAPPPPGPQPLSEDRDPAIQLYRLPAALSLPDSSLPSDASPSSSYGVVATRRGAREWSADLPFHVQDPRFPPPGMRVWVGDEELPYRMAAGERAWRLKGDALLLREQPGDGPVMVRIEHPALTQAVDRLQAARSGLSPEEFVHYALVGKEKTRQGLLLPAPATATWTLRVPQGAHLRATVSMVPSPLKAASDGAALTVELLDGDRWIALDEAKAEVGRSRELDLSLERWAGQERTLRLRSSAPSGDAAHDYVFVGAPTIVASPPTVRRVVVIGIDTLRPDHLGTYGYPRPTSPELDAFASESVVFERALAPAPRTRPSFRTATTGRFPLEAVGAPTVGSVFSQAGFATAGIVSNVHLHPRFGFHQGYDLWWQDPESKADSQVDRALDWLRQNEHRDTFLFLHLMDPHLFYDAPGGYRERFVEDPDPSLPSLFNRWEGNSWPNTGALTPQRIAHVKALYDGEIAWTSAQVGRFLEGLDALGGSSAVVLHSDHGDEHWEHGGFEHNHSLYQELVHAALWIRLPDRRGARTREVASLADLTPTLYELAGINDVPPTDGVSLVPALGGAGLPDRALPLGHLAYGSERWGVVAHGKKYILHTWDGEEELYDLDADPGESRNLAVETDTTPWLAALSAAHRTPAGHGLTLELRLSRQEPLSWRLPAKALAAWVIDPEAARDVRANQAWGERPPLLPEEVGTVGLSEDGLLLTFTPGPHPQGKVAVLLSSRWPERGGLSLDHTPGRMERGEHLPWVGGGIWSAGDERLRVRVAPVIQVPPGEAARMGVVDQGSAEEEDLLQTLGYIGGP
ncbi:MAG: sulfatase [Deltaproteobacteria bacterium]|nr:sulfatase [Deltaproteobacteria bacterium]